MENFPPYFEESDPTFFRKDLFAPQTFKVKVRDRNPLDLLYVRWVSDYPEFVEAFSKLLVEDVVGADANLTYGPVPANCGDFRPSQDATHRLVVIVSDRPFYPPADAPNPAIRYSYATKDAVTIMAGWSITCQ